MADKQIIEQPYNGYSRLEDEDGNPLSLHREHDISAREDALFQILTELRIMNMHLAMITGETFKPEDTER